MAVQKTAGGTLITGEHIHLHREAGIAIYLALEVNTGLRHSRGSVMLAANSVSERLDLADMREAGLDVPAGRLGTKRTKRGALADITVYLSVVWGWEPTDSVRKALGADLSAQCERKAARITRAIAPVIAEMQAAQAAQN
jgi:hypothetical protein